MSYKIGSPEWTENVTKSARDNRANQLNPNNDAYWSSRGLKNDGSDSDSSNMLAIAAIAAGVAAVAGAIVYAAHRFFGKRNDATKTVDAETIADDTILDEDD